MAVVVRLFNPPDLAFVQECETLDEAFELLHNMIKSARQLDKAKYPLMQPRLRDQTLLNLARWFTGDAMNDETERLFIELGVRGQRSGETKDVKLIAAFGVADAMTAALDDPSVWPDFDAKYDELRQLCA